MIKKIKDTIKNFLINEEELECSVDEEVVDCETFKEEPYIGVVAPVVLPDDPWFGSAPKTKKQMTYIQEQLYQEEMQQKCMSVEGSGRVKEPENIHQVMYEMATSNGATTLQLDPIGGSETFQGGSENYHEQSYTRSVQ